ncbi:unnamed protein product [Danaus chrysippus]|uniref:(African queen) hypothetical protein n=1 Tax=Danaus chrysippus TaxID=151541 RepID=A0A8J2QGY4_9NEOP|nr:unnamed protein product [Danaus chrysippus]
MTDGGGAHTSEDSCDPQELRVCRRNTSYCSCARDSFMFVCSPSASDLLRRMSWVLAQDVAACSQHPRAHCSAPPPHTQRRQLSVISVLSGLVLFPYGF